MVNRVWAQLFGTGIVETVEDFGTSGTPPSHPELLDYLALRFQNEHGWSVKQLLREMVLSATYRQSSRITPANARRRPAKPAAVARSAAAAVGGNDSRSGTACSPAGSRRRCTGRR